MSNLINSITDLVTPDLLTKAAGHFGESEASINKGIGALVPTILGGLTSKSNDTSAFGKVFDSISGTDHGGILSNLGSFLGPNASANSGASSLISAAMGSGSKLDGALGLLGKFAGISKGTATGLLGFVGPLVTGFLGKLVSSKGLGALGLAKLLKSQSGNIFGAIPSGIGSALGLSAPAAAVAGAAKAGGSFMKWLAPIALIGAVAFGGWYFLSDGAKDKVSSTMSKAVEGTKAVGGAVVDKTKDVGSAVVDKTKAVGGAVVDGTKAVGGAVADGAEAVADKTASLFTKELSCGKTITGNGNGIEQQLVTFIDSDEAISKGKWFNFDRLVFATGSSKLDQEKSGEQLTNLVSIMSCYPNATVKIGGYTDNTGSASGNKKLSAKRAKAVEAALVAAGIDTKRIETEGFGSEFPACPANDTDECKAQNRRIALSLRSK